MTNSAKLKECPFCGSAKVDPRGWTSTHSAGPACDDCGANAGSPLASEEDNLAAWNRRATPAITPADLAAAVEAEREACAGVCDGRAQAESEQLPGLKYPSHRTHSDRREAARCAAAIRARAFKPEGSAE